MKTTSYCVGNGQMHQVQLQSQVGTLNCMHDQQIVLTEREREHGNILRCA